MIFYKSIPVVKIDKHTKISIVNDQKGTKMLIKERQNKLLEIIRERKYCTVNFLSQKLCVAPITIRRDLQAMEHAGLINRCFGGATIPDYENREVPFDVRNQSNFSVKEQLAKRAAKLIRAGDVVFLDASSTVSRITEHLTAEQDLTVITNSTLVAEKLKEKRIRCYLTGGLCIENSYTLVGSLAERSISEFYANICFFSAQAVDENGTISDQSELETALRKLMIKNSAKQYFLFDSSKYSKHMAFRLGSVGDLTGYLTDLDVDFSGSQDL